MNRKLHAFLRIEYVFALLKIWQLIWLESDCLDYYYVCGLV